MTALGHPHTQESSRLERFALFNREGGKFRVAVINSCNLNCFFCHNEAMPNPRSPGQGPNARAGQRKLPIATPADVLLQIIDAYTALGGRQVDITGGEPLAHPHIVELLESVEKRSARLVLNTNAVLADRLLGRPRVKALDGILASLHTTDEAVFRDELGGSSAQQVMDNIVALAGYGYAVEINTSLGPYNTERWEAVLAFALEHDIALKAIALVRPNEDPEFYGGDWVDPAWIIALLERNGAERVETRAVLGGHTSTYRVGPRGTRVKVKNIARGRLRTDFCGGCSHEPSCGEGIYGLRVGVDGLWKPCLLRADRVTPVQEDRPYREQILDCISAMVGDWTNARFVTGAPA